MGLVGALVGRKARVAIDAEETLRRGADVVRREGGEGGIHLLDEREHGGLELALVDGPARLEPCAVVVAGEPAQKFEGLRGEVRGHLGFLLHRAAAGDPM